MRLLLLLTALLALTGVRCLKMGCLGVPAVKSRGETALLVCDYELEDDGLYSVKWYKDDEEFYRYVPKSTPPMSGYKVEGVKVDLERSDDKRVSLRPVTLQSSGVYRCEVSAEAPSFASAQREARMDVVYVPEEGPHITGEQRTYLAGEEISLNCTSGRSFPASVLHWYINDQQVLDSARLERYPDMVHHHGLVTTSLGLRFRLSPEHLRAGVLSLRCVASILPASLRRAEDSPSASTDRVREALLLVRASSRQRCASLLVVAAMTSLALSTVT